MTPTFSDPSNAPGARADGHCSAPGATLFERAQPYMAEISQEVLERTADILCEVLEADGGVDADTQKMRTDYGATS